MLEKSFDRRVVRSKLMLRNALLREIEEKGYDAVSVNSLVERADLNRSTFYAHYKDKHDLLEKTMDEVLTKLRNGLREFDLPKDTLPTVEEIRTSTLKLFELISEDVDVYRVMLVGKGDLEFISKLQDSIDSIISTRYSKFRFFEMELEIPIDLLVAYANAAIIGIIKWWIKTGLQYSPTFMVRKVEQLMIDNSEFCLLPVSPVIPRNKTTRNI